MYIYILWVDKTSPRWQRASSSSTSTRSQSDPFPKAGKSPSSHTEASKSLNEMTVSPRTNVLDPWSCSCNLSDHTRQMLKHWYLRISTHFLPLGFAWTKGATTGLFDYLQVHGGKHRSDWNAMTRIHIPEKSKLSRKHVSLQVLELRSWVSPRSHRSRFRAEARLLRTSSSSCNL